MEMEIPHDETNLDSVKNYRCKKVDEKTVKLILDAFSCYTCDNPVQVVTNYNTSGMDLKTQITNCTTVSEANSIVDDRTVSG